MGIEVAGKDSPKNRRVAWFASGALAVLVGLSATTVTLLAVESLAGLAVSMLIVVPSLLWVTAGVRVFLRVTGKKSEVQIASVAVSASAISATVGLIGTFLAVFFWVISRSVWLNEGGTPETVPNDALLYAVISLAVTVACLVLAFVSAKIDDPPPKGSIRG